MTEKTVKIPFEKYNSMVNALNAAARVSVYRDDKGAVCQKREDLPRDVQALSDMAMYVQHWMGGLAWMKLKDSVQDAPSKPTQEVA